MPRCGGSTTTAMSRPPTSPAAVGCRPIPSNATLPPLIPIDHILLNDRLTASSVTSFAVAGTDHRGLRAVIGGTR